MQGRVRNNIQFNPAREFASEQLEQNEKKKKRLLSRADDFNAHFNSKQMLQNPKYREVVNVENKNYIDDVEGLKTAYANNTGLFRSGNTLYISGTGGKSGIGAKVNDVFSDIFLIPTHNLQFSDKYRDVMNELEKKPRCFGNSWSKNPHHLGFSNRGDVLQITLLIIEIGSNNPIQAHNFDNAETQGAFRVGEDNGMGVSSHPGNNYTTTKSNKHIGKRLKLIKTTIIQII